MRENPGDPGCTCYRLRQAARVASRVYDRHLQAVGLNIGQLGILLTIEAADGISITELAQLSQIERTTVSRLLPPLERLGLLSVDPGINKRTRALNITRSGRRILSQAKPLWREAQRKVEKSLGKADTKALHLLLERGIDQLHDA